MPVTIASADRKVLIGLGLLFVAVLFLVAYAISTDGGSGDIPSSYSAGNSGTKAAFLLLEQLGYAPQRWIDEPIRLEQLPSQTTLVLAEPQPSEEPDMDSVRRFAARGGRVVITGDGGRAFFPEHRPRPGMPHFQWKAYKPSEPSDLTRGIDEIFMAPQFYFDSSLGETPFSDKDERPVTRFAYGKGEVIWWSAADPMTNSGIREKDNVQLLLNSVGEAGSGPVYWDEYFHQNRKTVIDSILESPLRWGLLQLALTGLVVAFTFSRHFGPMRESAAVSRAAPMEYVETLAALYHRAKAAHIPLEIVYERLRAVLQRRYSLRKDASLEQTAQTISDHLSDADSNQVLLTLREIENSMSDHSVAVNRTTALVQRMHEWMIRLK
jgi:hypothetical protein